MPLVAVGTLVRMLVGRDEELDRLTSALRHGRSAVIVGPAGILVTRVLYLKEGGGKRFVITDAGMNDLLRPSHYAGYHAVEPIVVHDRAHVRVDVVGPICETGDFLALDREIEIVEPGELLALRTAGAYGFSMSSTYNQRPRPAEVMVDGADAELTRRRETIEDLVRGEVDLEDEEDTALLPFAWLHDAKLILTDALLKRGEEIRRSRGEPDQPDFDQAEDKA